MKIKILVAVLGSFFGVFMYTDVLTEVPAPLKWVVLLLALLIFSYALEYLFKKIRKCIGVILRKS